MNERIKPWMILTAILVVCLVAGSAIWYSSTASSNFKPQPASTIMTAEQVEKNVQDVQNNPRIPDDQKAMIIAHLRQNVAGGSGPKPSQK
jgi:hypothetical protein